MKMQIGLIKWFDRVKGYGIIKSFPDQEVFIHVSEFSPVPDKLEIGTALIYEKRKGRNGRVEAVSAHAPHSYEDWVIIMSSLGKSESVTMEVELTGHGKAGRPFRKKEDRSFSIRGYAGNQILKRKSTDDVVAFVTKYYTEFILPSKPELFYAYVKFIKLKLKERGLPDTGRILKEIYTCFGANKNNVIIYNAWVNNDPFVLKYLVEDELSPIDGLRAKSNTHSLFPTHDLTTSLFEEVASIVAAEHVSKIKSLPDSDTFLFLIFSLRFSDFKQNKTLEEYRFLTTLIDSLSNEDKKEQCGVKLKSELSFIDEITDDKVLFEIYVRFPSESFAEVVLKQWNHQNVGLTLSLLSRLSESGYELGKIPNSFFVPFLSIATTAEIKKLIAIYSAPFIVDALVKKVDITKQDQLQYLNDLSLSDEHLSLLYAEIEVLLVQVVSKKSYNDLRQAYNAVCSLGDNASVKRMKQRIEEISVSILNDALHNMLTNEKSLNQYNFSSFSAIYNRCVECLFNESEKQKVRIVFDDFILLNGDSKAIVKAWKEGYIASFDQYILSELNAFSSDELQTVFSSGRLEKTIINEIILKRLSVGDNYEWALRNAIAYLAQDQFASIDSLIFKTAGIESYFKFWEMGLGKIMPVDYIATLLMRNSAELSKIKRWHQSGLCKSEDVTPILINILNSVNEVSDRNEFYLKSECIKCLVELESSNIKKILDTHDDFAKLILWFLELNDDFNLQLLQKKFIYFKPTDQVKLIKRLFYLKHHKKIDFSIHELDAILRADVDLFLLNNKFNEDFVLDISTSLVIELIKNYAVHGRFLADSELLKLVLHDIGSKRSKKFKFENYFENCRGRMTAKWDWSSNGTIHKRQNGDGVYYEIIFDYSEHLVNTVKEIPGRRYSADAKSWIVPVASEKQVVEFGRKNRFFFDLGGNNYSNNPHLAKLERSAVPNGIQFCEGRISNKMDSLLNKAFWWCANQKCLQNCETDHLIKKENKSDSSILDFFDNKTNHAQKKAEYEELTLLDFLKIFNINVDENSKYGFFPNGKYYHLIGQINRFNRLLDRLYCQSCDEILFPVQSSNFAAYTVVRFSCQNDKCAEHDVEVYLNHCLDGSCNDIIDSRVSKKCENGLYICTTCGGCCSHDMLSRRLNNLQTTGGTIHPQLVRCVEGQLGHKEKNEYFCYKCSNLMTEVIDDISGQPNFFKCLDCDTEYHPSSVLQRPHLYLRRKDYPIIRASQIRNKGNDGS